MATEYRTKERALEWGCHYAGITRATLDRIAPEEVRIGWPHDITLEGYRVTTAAGRIGVLGVAPMGDGYQLWLIDAETGGAQRT